VLIPGTSTFDAHVNAVHMLADAGVEPPAEWLHAEGRWEVFHRLGDSSRIQLGFAIADGGDADIDVLFALSLAEAASTPQTQAAVRNQVQAAVHAKMQRIYNTVAPLHYARVADLFDTAATKLTEAAKLVDVELQADQIVHADQNVRNAWSQSLVAAHELDALAPVLAAAATLAGLHADTKETLITLTVNPGEIKRRALWAIWEGQPGRCSIWGKLLAEGCTIRAHRDLNELEPYRRPMAMERRQARGDVGIYYVDWDPEEHTDEPEPETKRKTLRAHKISR
jgi:hypothetical protein